MARPNRLLAEYLPAMRAMPFAKAEELAGMGIPWTAIAAVCPAPMRIVIDRAGDRFWPDDAGELGWVFPVAAVDPCCPELIESDDPLATVSTGAIIDLAASFSPGAPGLWALRLGHATVLGAIPPQYMAPPPVRVHRDITAWLRAGCNGIVLLTRDQDEAQRILRQIHRIDYEDDAEQDSSPAPFQSGPALNRRRLEWSAKSSPPPRLSARGRSAGHARCSAPRPPRARSARTSPGQCSSEPGSAPALPRPQASGWSRPNFAQRGG